MSIFDVRKQLTFYGAYHSHPTNVLIHIICVPILLWTYHEMISYLPVSSFLPHVHKQWNEYLAFDLNVSAIFSGLYLLYYLILEPVAALLYVSQMVLSLLTATAFSYRPNALLYTLIIHVICWTAQFIGHGFAEKRAPALLDNLVGALVLAPFFVHLEVLFKLGYRPQLHKQLQNDVGVEIARIRKIEGDKKRAAAVKKEN